MQKHNSGVGVGCSGLRPPVAGSTPGVIATRSLANDRAACTASALMLVRARATTVAHRPASAPIQAA